MIIDNLVRDMYLKTALTFSTYLQDMALNIMAYIKQLSFSKYFDLQTITSFHLNVNIFCCCVLHWW